MRHLKNKILGVILTALFLLLILPVTTFGASRDCDDNSVIYCGSLTVDELWADLTYGTGKAYQSAAELQSLFSKFGITIADLSSANIKDGKVTKDGKIYIGTSIYATGVMSMGRHRTTHSVQVDGVPYPLYLRPPSDSFLSTSIPAFVYLNPDNTVAWAIIKSCGNIVPGVGIRRPTPPPTPTTPIVKPTVSIKIQKFEDKNANKKKDFGESFLEHWNFKITGPNINQVVSSDRNGNLALNGLTPGTYTVTEILQTGWENTTGLSITKVVNTSNTPFTFIFGNRKKTPTTIIPKKTTIPTTPTIPPGGDTTTMPTQLPVSGPAETAAGVTSFALTGALLYWLNSKKKLKLSFRKNAK